MTFDQAMLITKGNREAALWLVDYDAFCGLMDDIIDEGEVSQSRLVQETLNLLGDLSNPGWARENAPRLFPLIVAAANTWLDSNKLALEVDARKRLASDVLKSQYTEMERFVAFLCGGFEHMRAVSQNRHFDFDLTPKEDK
jgi:hypothetical protein